MKKYILGLLILTSCYTQKKAEKQLSHINVSYPTLIANTCAEKFPVKENTIYKEGKTVFKSDTVIVEGKKIPCPPSIDKNGNIDTFFVQCPPSKRIIDTIRKTDTLTVYYENTALTASKDAQISDLTSKLDESTKSGKTKTKWLWYLGIAVIGLGLWTAKKFFI